MGLLGQLARGRHDQRAHLAARAVQQALQDGQHEGGRLAGAGLGQARSRRAPAKQAGWLEVEWESALRSRLPLRPS